VEETEPREEVKSILKKDPAPPEAADPPAMTLEAIPIPPDPPSAEPPEEKTISKWEEVPVASGDAKGTGEDLTNLEKFLKNLKTNKKKQWIAEGKVKEDE